MGNSTGRRAALPPRLVWMAAVPPATPPTALSETTICSEDVSTSCAWEERHTRVREAPYVCTTLCRTHRYSLATALVHLLLSGNIDGLQVASDAQVLVLVRNHHGSAAVSACRLLNACAAEEPPHHHHARFVFEAGDVSMPSVPLDGVAAAKLVFTLLAVPATWVVALSQHHDDADAAARMKPLGKWLMPPATPAAADAARIVRVAPTEDAPRALEWKFTDALRRDFCAQPMSVLFRQTTFPDPTLPHSGLCSLWSYLSGTRGGKLYTRAVALTPPPIPPGIK